jgi:amino-acid N-acetyltransferase
MVNIEPASAGDVDAILAFLQANDLPDAGFRDNVTDIVAARDTGRLVGTAALEIYGRDALLRSVAVARELRGTGLGGSLTRAALARARERGVERVFLLTETAPAFFARHGFNDIDRGTVPDTIRATVEFTSACPASARVMRAEF